MAYTKVHEAWEDSPSVNTPILAAGLDQIEEGVQDAHDLIDNHIADAADAHDASAVSVVPSGGISSTDVQSALVELDSSIMAGGIPATIVDAKGELIAATAADAVDNVPAATADGLVLTSDSAQGTGVKWAATGLTDHLSDTSDAHDASAISIVDSGGYFTGTEVEAALQEAGAAMGAGGVSLGLVVALGGI